MYEWESLISEDHSDFRWEEGRIIFELIYREIEIHDERKIYAFTSPFKTLRDEFGFSDSEFDKLVSLVGANENYTTRNFCFDSSDKRDQAMVMVGHLLYGLYQKQLG